MGANHSSPAARSDPGPRIRDGDHRRLTVHRGRWHHRSMPAPEAVIVATARSPIGRAAKGSLVNARPDDLAAQIVSAAMQKVPSLPADAVEDLIMGCGQPAGEAGYNVGRVVSILAGLPNAPGVTV